MWAAKIRVPRCHHLQYVCSCDIIGLELYYADLKEKYLTFLSAVVGYLKVVGFDSNSSFCQIVNLTYNVLGINLPVWFRFVNPKCNIPVSSSNGMV